MKTAPLSRAELSELRNRGEIAAVSRGLPSPLKSAERSWQSRSTAPTGAATYRRNRQKTMTTFEKLQKAYPKSVRVLKRASEIPSDTELVYILTYNDSAVVVGRGKKNRAAVIFDDLENVTVHVKALKVRLYHLFRQENDIFERYIVICQNEAESKDIEKRLHEEIGGNTLSLDERLIGRLLKA